MGVIATDRRASDEVNRDEVKLWVGEGGFERDMLKKPTGARGSAGHSPHVAAAAAAKLSENSRLRLHDKPAQPTLREEDGAEDTDDETGGCADATYAAAETVAMWVTRRLDLLLGLAFLGVALWLRTVKLIGARSSSPLARDEHNWRWVLFVACVFLGRFLARSLVSFAVFVLDRYNRAYPSDDADTLNSILYYLTVLRTEIKTFLLVLGITISWSTLMRPVRQIGAEAFANTARGMSCACVALFFRVLHQWIIKKLTSRLHSSTFWEQLHSTVRQENILKKLAGPPIRPRPRGNAKTRARWALVRAASRSRSPSRRPKLGAEDAKTGTGAGKGAGTGAGKGGGMRTVRSFDNLVDRVASAIGRSRASGSGSGAGPSSGPSGPSGPSRPADDDDDAKFWGKRSDAGSDAGSDDWEPRTHRGGLPTALGHATLRPVATGAGAGAGVESPPPSTFAAADDWTSPGAAAAHDASGSETPLSDTVDGARLSSGSSTASSLGGEHAAYDAPISAAAAAAAVGASEGAHEAKTNVSLAVINAAVRHVRRGTFSLPFRVTTKAIGALKGKGKSAGRSSRDAGSAPAGRSFLDGKRSGGSGKGGKFSNAGALGGDTTTVEQEADAAATMMFNHLRRAGQPFVTPDAVADFVEADKVEEAFLLIGGADAGVRALAEANISAAMRKIYVEREALGKTLSDTSGLVKNVGVLIAIVLGTVALFISLGIFRVDVASLWLVTSSALLAFAFVFGTTAATMFRALIMIFVTNPFGVGDWIRIGEQIVRVTELGLNFFVVVNFWGEVIFLPASQVLDAHIFNLSRSPPLWMNTTFDVDIGVSAADIEHLQTVMSAHIDSDGTNYTPGSFSIYCRDMHDPLKVHVMCFYQLAFNASEFDRKLKANSRFLLALQIALMDINFTFAGTDGMIFKCEERLVGPTNASTPRRASRVLAAGRHNSDLGPAGSGAGSRRVSVSHGARAPGGAGGDAGDEMLRGVGGPPGGAGGPVGNPLGATLGNEPPRPVDAPAPARDVPPVPRPPERHDSIGDIRAAGFVLGDATKIPDATPASEGVAAAGGGGGAHLPVHENSVPKEVVHVPGVGYILPEKHHGMRFRGRYRIPGRIRHYSGMLRDMREVVTFDAHEGQFND